MFSGHREGKGLVSGVGPSHVPILRGLFPLTDHRQGNTEGGPQPGRSSLERSRPKGSYGGHPDKGVLLNHIHSSTHRAPDQKRLGAKWSPGPQPAWGGYPGGSSPPDDSPCAHNPHAPTKLPPQVSPLCGLRITWTVPRVLDVPPRELGQGQPRGRCFPVGTAAEGVPPPGALSTPHATRLCACRPTAPVLDRALPPEPASV